MHPAWPDAAQAVDGVPRPYTRRPARALAPAALAGALAGIEGIEEFEIALARN